MVGVGVSWPLEGWFGRIREQQLVGGKTDQVVRGQHWGGPWGKQAGRQLHTFRLLPLDWREPAGI